MNKLDGVEEINCDTGKRVASFKVTDPDYESKLAEFAKTNSHLKGYKIQ